MKVSKTSAQYGKGMKSAHCSICEHYLGGHECNKVAGHIDPAMWCRFFHKRSAEVVAEMRKRRGQG